MFEETIEQGSQVYTLRVFNEEYVHRVPVFWIFENIIKNNHHEKSLCILFLFVCAPRKCLLEASLIKCLYKIWIVYAAASYPGKQICKLNSVTTDEE